MPPVESPPAKDCGLHFEIQNPAKPPCDCQGLRKPRRYHAILGFYWIGFLLLHLAVAATGIRPVIYQTVVNQVETVARVPGLLLLAILLPFVLQACSGIYILSHHGLRYHIKQCNRGGKFRFFLQRWSAVLILLFLVLHIATLHGSGLSAIARISDAPFLHRYLSGGLFESSNAFASTRIGLTHAWTSSASLGNGIALLFTCIGVIATIYHLTNGLWTGGLVLRIITRDKRRRLWATVCLVAGAVIAFLGIVSFLAFTGSF